ncbi:MAG: DUF4097 family beta strand repeat-containing protein [Terracidiphilus sp.]
MSTTPPSTPPGGPPPPYPPYDPRTQYRIYREQQKAAWRAQRDAWKAQRYAMKSSYVGAYGPRVPSVVGPIILIGVGVIALLLLTGHINSGGFWAWYGHWWPLILIGAGLALLAEWAVDMRRKTPVRRGGSFVGILVLLALLGVGAAAWNHSQTWMSHWDNQDNDFFNFFGLPEHDLDQQVLNSQIPANAAIEINNPRGDVSVTAGETSTIQVQAHEMAYADSDSNAKKIFDNEAAHVTVNGGTVLIKSENDSKGRVNLTITVPKSSHLTINSGWGDVTAAGLGAGVDVTARGDIHVSSISGSVQVHFINGRHDTFAAHDVQGDVILSGDVNDLTLSEIKGNVTQNGELLGDVHLETIRGPVHLHTSVTDLELAELPGDLTLDSDDLRVNEAKGTVHITTRSKDIDLNQIYGDSYVETRNGRIAVEPAGTYAVEAKNDKGDVELTLPPNPSASINARTHNGDIVNDFDLPISGDENKSLNGKIGAGAARVVLSAEDGDVRIKKGSGFPPEPPAVSSATPTSHVVPGISKAPHLKAPKVPPAPPSTQ